MQRVLLTINTDIKQITRDKRIELIKIFEEAFNGLGEFTEFSNSRMRNGSGFLVGFEILNVKVEIEDVACKIDRELKIEELCDVLHDSFCKKLNFNKPTYTFLP